MTNADELHAAVRAWAKGLYATEAAVELLIQANLLSAGDPWVQRAEDNRRWWIDFEGLAAALEEGTHHSGGQQRILATAASLGGHSPDGYTLADALPGLDRAHLTLVLAAIAHTGGSHEHRDTSALQAAADNHEPVTAAMLAGRPLPPLHPWPQPASAPAQPSQWTVGQLRAELVGLPDDTPLVVDICTDNLGTGRTRRPLIGAGYGPDIDPTTDIFTGQEYPLLAGHRHPSQVSRAGSDGGSQSSGG